MRSVVLGALLAVGWIAGAAAQDPVVALVKRVEGKVFVLRDGALVPLDIGSGLRLKDVIETQEGAVGFTFKDGSRVSIGENSRIALQEFQYDPAEGRLAFLVSLLRGTMLYASGIIAKLAPGAVKVETPVATVAVRGTRFAAKVEEN